MLFCCCSYDLIYSFNPAIVYTCCLTLERNKFSFFGLGWQNYLQLQSNPGTSRNRLVAKRSALRFWAV